MKTENRKFYDVMKEWGKDFPSVKNGTRVNLPFWESFQKMGLPTDTYLADYDESVDYRCVTLSFYYFSRWWSEQPDSEGNREGKTEVDWRMERLMRKHGISEEYIHEKLYPDDGSSYKDLAKKYNLILWW